MMNFKDKLWLCGKVPGAEHYGDEFHLPGDNRMTPAEAAFYLGLSNLCYITTHGYPKKPYDYTLESLTFLDRIIWSVEDEEAAYEVARLSKYYDNIVGALVINDGYDEILAGLPKWAFVTEENMETLHACDNTVLWTYNPENFCNVKENVNKFKSSGKGLYLGVYLWDYKNKKELDAENFGTYLDTVFELLKKGEIDGVFINSNCVMDIELESVKVLKEKL